MKIGSMFNWMISIVSLGFAFYIWFRDTKEREPTFIVNPIRSKIIDSEILKNRPLNITDSTGKVISDNVYVITFYFFNQGKQYIENSDVLTPIRIGIKDGKVLDKRIISAPRGVAKLSLSGLNNNENEFPISFRILEEGDGFTGQIIYSGSEDAKLYIVGDIKDVKQFSYSYKRVRAEQYVLYITCALVLSLIFIRNVAKRSVVRDRSVTQKQGRTASLLEMPRAKKTLSERLTTQYLLVVRSTENLAESRGVYFTYAKLIVILSTMFMIVFISSLVLSKTLFSKFFDKDNFNKLEIPIEFRK